MTISTLLFDVGGVLLRTEDRSHRQRLEDRLGLEPGESEVHVFSGPMGLRAQRGEITIHELWSHIQKEFSFNDQQLADFQKDFWGGDRMDHALVDRIRAVRPRLKTGVISNAFDDLHHTLHNIYGVSDAFDKIIVSACEGVMKPDPKIYRSALEYLDVPPEETIFIDDFEHNVLGAQELGMHAIFYQPGIDLSKELAQFSIEF